MVRQINIDQVEAGMVLGAPIVNKFGQILLGSDVTLTSKHLGFFKLWNIEFISIVIDEELEEQQSISDEEFKMAIDNLLLRMSWKPRNANEEELYELGLAFELSKFSKMKAS